MAFDLYNGRRGKNRWHKPLWQQGGFWGVLLLIVLAVGGCGAYLDKATQQHSTTFTITGKLYHGGGSGGHGNKYLIYTNKGTYEDTDSIWQLKFNSSDLFGQLRVGHTYTCKYVGWRVPLFSWYHNLVSCKEIQ